MFNPVAKHAFKLNKYKVEKDKTKYSRKGKNKWKLSKND